MKKLFGSCFAVAILLIATLPVSATPDWFDFKYKDGFLRIGRLSDAEMNKLEEELRSVSEGRLPQGSTGSYIFDGRVVRSYKNDRFGQPSWLVKPSRVYIGKVRAHRALTIKSPTIQDGGTELETGKDYRILAVPFQEEGTSKHKAIFVWRGTVLDLSTLPSSPSKH